MSETATSPDEQDTWLLLRGLTREVAHWGDFVERLRIAVAPAPVLAVDLPGAGSQHHQPCPLSLDGMLDDVRQRAMALRLEQGTPAGRWRLVGQSLGGILSLQWWRRYPAEVRGAALINTSAGGISPPQQRLSWRNWKRLVQLLGNEDAVEREHTILQLTSNRADVQQALTPVWADIARQRPMTQRNLLAQLMAAARFALPDDAETAARLRGAPVLLIASESDRLVDPRCSHALHEHFGWPMRLHPRAGHDLPLDDAPWLLAELLDWSQPTREKT